MKRVPFDILAAAKEGDGEAVDIVSRHFEDFIRSSSNNFYIDANGIPHEFFDDELFYRGEYALLKAILQFKFMEPPDDFMP